MFVPVRDDYNQALFDTIETGKSTKITKFK